MVIMVLFLVYFPRRSDIEQSQGLDEDEEAEIPRPRDAVIVAVSSLAALLVAGLGSLFYLVRSPQYLLGWANFLGVTASVLACVQYLPQIWTTYRLGKVLSLSIATMLIQTPGSFLFSFSLFLRVGWQGWSSWLVYCVTGTLQAGLLAMAIRFWLRDRREARSLQDSIDRAPTERDPLLSTRPENSSTLRTINGAKKRHSIDILYSATPPGDGSLPSDSEGTTASASGR